MELQQTGLQPVEHAMQLNQFIRVPGERLHGQRVAYDLRPIVLVLRIQVRTAPTDTVREIQP
ncbi:hypothetical protein [Glycomyces buryatensis]|uniref:Uncharacterized protein n=1 Tax=Glycomyces buryatensis TaxID=2570927 RepID=A0A4S8Q548_9ACTN|nr:hypothetical protein [Glycomyces buryatensis]THV37745.1 hypothetical protein FAB82_20085 [Glycomyces buryatensis]